MKFPATRVHIQEDSINTDGDHVVLTTSVLRKGSIWVQITREGKGDAYALIDSETALELAINLIRLSKGE